MTESNSTGEGAVPKPKVIYDFDPHNLPYGFLQAIGLVIAAASQTESVMRDFVGALLKIDNTETLALSLHMSFPLKDDVIRALTELNAPSASEVDEIDDLLDEVKAAMVKRNSYAHNSFMRNPETNEVFTLRERARGSLLVTLTPVTVEEIRKDAGLIYEVGMKLMSFMMSRGVGPTFRTEPIRETLDRRKKARAERRDRYGTKY